MYVYSAIRACIIFLIILGVFLILNKTLKKSRKFCLTIALLIGIWVGYMGVKHPFAFSFEHFDTPEEAYVYGENGSVSSAKLVAEGVESGLVIVEGTENPLIYGVVHKDKTLWTPKQARLSYTSLSSSSNVDLTLCRYGNTEDYYLFIYLISQAENSIDEITDSRKSEFYPCTSNLFVTYIPDFDYDYWIEVNGQLILLKK